MIYTDMHCDTLTECSSKGFSLRKNMLQADFARLKAAGCAAQCFAIFTKDSSAAEFFGYADFFMREVSTNSDICAPVLAFSDFEKARAAGKLGCILTAENLSFLSCAEDVEKLHSAGVRMASLVWNDENALAYPNLKFCGAKPDFSAREARGLKPHGEEIAHRLDECGIITDVSHLSDGGLADLLRSRKKPLVASHSNAFSLCGVSRNLTDMQIKRIADCGGVIGVNFCLDFLGGESAFVSSLRHISHLISVGGEDCAAFGSDFDGMPEQSGMEDCTRMTELCNVLYDMFGGRVAEKIASGNFIRVFKEVCG